MNRYDKNQCPSCGQEKTKRSKECRPCQRARAGVRIEKACEECGSAFLATRYFAARQKHCSLSCNVRKRNRLNPQRQTVHGHSSHSKQSATYVSWHKMKDRCLNPNNRMYPRYGGRGIKVCEAWMRFECFLADMGERPKGLFIERVNNDGGYEPANCRWGTREEQANNTSRNRYFEFQGERLTLAQWARRSGIHPDIFWGRLRRGWSVDRMLGTPTPRRTR